MDMFNRGGFPYNIGNTFNEEFFNDGYEPIYRLMNQPEIHVEQPHDYYLHGYPTRNNQLMHQFYHDDHHYGNDGYQSPRHGYDYPYAPQAVPFDMNQEREYPNRQISVDIRLSSRAYIDNHLIFGIHREGLSCEVRGSVITVTGYPANGGENGFLRLVQDISGDRGASIVW